jgi:hypothetical protein
VPEARDLAAARLAARQENLLKLAHLQRLGFSEKEIRARVRRGQLYLIHRAVYAWGTPNLTDRGRLLAAQWACGDTAFLSHATAAAVYGHGRINARKIELTVLSSGGRKRTDQNLILHRTRDTLDRREVRTWNGLRVSTFPRLLVEQARTYTPQQLQDLITFGVRKRLFKPHEVEAALERHARRPGISLAKAAVERYRPHPDRKSSLERSFDADMLTRPHIPKYEKNVYLGVWEIDCLWRARGVAVELDARDYHAAVQDFDKDRKKDNELLLMGVKPMRITEFVWEHDRASAIADLEAMLGLREPVFLQRR